MTDTNMTDTNIPHRCGGVPQDCGKRMRVLTTRRNDEGQKASLLLVVVCVVSWSAVQCLAQHQLCWVCWW